MKLIWLDFKPSITLTLIICVMSLGGGVILILLALIGRIKFMLDIIILSAVIYTVCQYGLLLPLWLCDAINISSSNQLELVRKDSKRLQVNICNDSVVTPYLTFVNCKVQDVNLFERLFVPHLVILPDMLHAESYRQLRVWLRWGKHTHT